MTDQRNPYCEICCTGGDAPHQRFCPSYRPCARCGGAVTSAYNTRLCEDCNSADIQRMVASGAIQIHDAEPNDVDTGVPTGGHYARVGPVLRSLGMDHLRESDYKLDLPPGFAPTKIDERGYPVDEHGERLKPSTTQRLTYFRLPEGALYFGWTAHGFTLGKLVNADDYTMHYGFDGSRAFVACKVGDAVPIGAHLFALPREPKPAPKLYAYDDSKEPSDARRTVMQDNSPPLRVPGTLADWLPNSPGVQKLVDDARGECPLCIDGKAHSDDKPCPVRCTSCKRTMLVPLEKILWGTAYCARGHAKAECQEMPRPLYLDGQWCYRCADRAKARGALSYICTCAEPTSKTCSECGWLKPELSLSERQWNCGACGCVHDRDVNAARNLKIMAESSSVTACGEDVSRSLRNALASLKQEPEHVWRTAAGR